MSASRPVIAITGIGAVSALGPDAETLRRRLLAGEDGLVPMRRVDLGGLGRALLAGEVRGSGDDAIGWARRAAEEALRDAGITRTERLAIVSGTTDGELGSIGGIALALKHALHSSGPALTISTACASSTNAIGLGRDLLERGEADVVLAGGAERLLLEMFAGFSALGVLGDEPCAPFGEKVGTTLGEGAGYVVLERRGERTGARVRATLLGWALSSDAFHETSPEPRGEGVARAVAGALADAQLPAEAIEYVNAHGTGTAANDDAEWRGLLRSLGAHAERVPISSTKGALGHAQGACGVLEAIATLVALEAGRLPPSLRIGRGRRTAPTRLTAGPIPEASTARTALATNAAFGGANAALVLGPADAPARGGRPRRTVKLIGAASIRRAPGEPPFRPALDHDLRSSDPATRLLLAASEQALAGRKIRGAQRERTGIYAAASRVSPESVGELRGSIERLGPARASASAFARTVLNAPAGAVSRFLSLRGPQTTLVADGVAGLLAVAEAAAALETRGDADTLLAAAWDERLDASEPEGAACLVLATDGPGWTVLGHAVGGDDLDATIARARQAVEAATAIALDGDGTILPASGTLHALIDVLARARGPVLVHAHAPAASVALVLSPPSEVP